MISPSSPLIPGAPQLRQKTRWHEIFEGRYRRRTFSVWVMWFCCFSTTYGLLTWLPTLYRTVFHLPVAEALARRGFRAHLGSLPHPDIPAASFDAVTMWHSLEHVPRPLDVLRAAASALRPGGILVVGVPNFASWSSRHFHQDWFGLALPRHLTHFTPATLGQMVESAGFQVASIDQTPRDGWIRKSARRALKRRDNPGTARLLRRRWLAMPVARWTEFTGQADSIRLIAEKPATAEAAM